jgi:hypothetical protein
MKFGVLEMRKKRRACEHSKMDIGAFLARLEDDRLICVDDVWLKNEL